MFGERLKLARKKAGLSLDQLVDAIDELVTKQAISKYERNLMMPDSNVLMALAKALDVSLDFLFGNAVDGLAGVDFRKTVRTSAKDRAKVEANVIDHMERYLALEEILELDSAEWVRPDLGNLRLKTVEDAERLAIALRCTWELGEDPIPDMTMLLEEFGIKVMMFDLPKSVSGMTCFAVRNRDDDSLPVIVVNQSHSLERRRFTLAHELAHRIFDRESISPSVDEELAAQRFAGAFLMHADHLRREVGKRRGKLGYQEIMFLKRMYRVSAAALVMRLQQIGIIAKKTLSTIFQTIGRTWRSKEPEPLEEDENIGKFEQPKRFIRLGLWALAEQYISPAKAVELLRITAADIRVAMSGPNANYC